MDKSKLLIAFNNHFFDLVSDILRVFPDDYDLKTAQTILLKLKKSNPKIILNIFIDYVLNNYKDEIMKGNIHYFIDKNYKQELKDVNNSVIEKFNTLKEPIRRMNKDDKEKVIKYIQNLIKLSEMYKINYM
jgi:hypothetical protein